ncbi:anti-sigma factor [Bacteroidia bacterium]|nr:anti-sigma factor [Bacteroidia bacterium]
MTIEKVLNNEASKAEAREVVRWFGTPEGQIWLSARMDADEMSIRLGEEEEHLDHLIQSEKIYKQITRKLKLQKVRRFLSAAAVIIPFILLAGLFAELNSRVNLFAQTEYNDVYVPKGERLKVMFQDGSSIYLNSESHIRYPKQFGLSERRVELEGEAWFEVAKEKKRPFVVDLKAFNIRVLGTSFDVKAYPEEENITVSLETGLVELASATFLPVSLNPGDKAVYNRSSKSYRISHPADIKQSSVWRNKTIVFTDSPLSEVITTLSRTFDVTFVIDNKAVLDYNYTLQTYNTDLSLILQELEKITPVRFQKNGKMINVQMKK